MVAVLEMERKVGMLRLVGSERKKERKERSHVSRASRAKAQRER